MIEFLRMKRLLENQIEQIRGKKPIPSHIILKLKNKIKLKQIKIY